jgi:DNA-binding beta-propeller fold protein YncE
MTRFLTVALFIAVVCAQLVPSTQAASFIVVNLKTSDLGYSPLSGQIYAAVPDGASLNPNTLTPINPATAALGTAIPIGFDPARIAVSSDGANVFTVIGDRRAVQRYHLPTFAADQLFSVAGGPVFDDMYAIPSRPNAVVLHESQPGISPPAVATVVYENGLLLPHQVGHGVGVGGPDIIAVDPADGTKAYGYQNTISSYDNVPMTISPLGIDATGPAALQGVLTGPHGPIAITGDHLFSNQGRIYSMSLGFQVGSFLGGGLFTLDANDHRLYTMTSSGTTKTFRAYSLDTLALVGTDVLTGIQGNPSSLIRLGSNAMAFRTSADQVVIFHSSAVVPEPRCLTIIAAALGLGVCRLRRIA